MSVEAITWALRLKVDRSSAKFVLVAMANCANHDMTCWPSIQYLADATCQDRKTVLENLRRLKEAGHIFDTGERKGYTSQVPVYLLNHPEIGTVKQAQYRDRIEMETGPFFPIKEPVFPTKEARFSVETGPKTGHGTVNEPSIEPLKNQTKASATSEPKKTDVVLPDWMPQAAWFGYLEMRTKKKKVPTARACSLILKKLEKLRADGQDVADVLDASTINEWTDVYPVKPEPQPRPRAATGYASAADKAKSFADRLTGEDPHEPHPIIDLN